MVDAIIWTEGKTDTQHLGRARDVLDFQYDIEFPVSIEMGDDALLKQCLALSKAPQSTPTVFIFDCDNPDIVSKAADNEKPYKNWGNNVFSFTVPIPDHRDDTGICIELLFTDDDLKKTDSHGRRLFLTSEFNPTSGRHFSDAALSVGHKGKLATGKIKTKLLDAEVYDQSHKNVALSKAEFATLIARGDGSFAAVDFRAFEKIFSIVEQIVRTKSVDILFGGIDEFLA